jgi:hypothetical protein
MLDLTPLQVGVLDRLQRRGFQLVAFPLYANYVGVRKGNCAALLAPVENGGMKLFGEACYLVASGLSVRVQRAGRTCFAWKQNEVEATPERLTELAAFIAELAGALEAQG